MTQQFEDENYLTTASEADTVSSDTVEFKGDIHFNFHRAPVEVFWEKADGTEGVQAMHMSLLHYQFERQASFTLSASVALPTKNPKAATLYLLIPPDRIRTLVVQRGEKPTRHKKETPWTLLFTMQQPNGIQLVGPKTPPVLTPKNKAAGEAWDCLHFLAQGSTTNFRLGLRRDAGNPGQWESLCHTVSGGQGKPISGWHAIDIENLYEGQGGRVIASGVGSLAENLDASPPEYSGPAAPATATEPRGKKRRRADSDHETVESKQGPPIGVLAQVMPDLEAIIQAEVRAEFDRRLPDSIGNLGDKRDHSEQNQDQDAATAAAAKAIPGLPQEFWSSLATSIASLVPSHVGAEMARRLPGLAPATAPPPSLGPPDAARWAALEARLAAAEAKWAANEAKWAANEEKWRDHEDNMLGRMEAHEEETRGNVSEAVDDYYYGLRNEITGYVEGDEFQEEVVDRLYNRYEDEGFQVTFVRAGR